MITLPDSLLAAAIVALVTWIYNQSITIAKLQANQDAIDSKMDAKIDKKVSESTTKLNDVLHELQLTIRELNTTIIYIKEELKEIKRNNG